MLSGTAYHTVFTDGQYNKMSHLFSTVQDEKMASNPTRYQEVGGVQYQEFLGAGQE